MLTNFKYRDAMLQITVKGHGHVIDKFLLDGQTQTSPFFAASSTGEHKIEIVLR
jgi:hypothetical protein